jgi:D-glycero-beta-D-manno-heptose 1-phosphate adenylyltransferase
MEKIQWVNNKILSWEALVQEAHIWQLKKKKVVFTNGCFDLLHRGHLDLLARAANEGDILVVGLNSDASVKRLKGASRPVNNEADRAFQLASLLCVDAVCIFEEDTPLKLIEALCPNVLVKGGDYTAENIVGAEFVTKLGGTVAVIPFIDGYSTTSLIQKIQVIN